MGEDRVQGQNTTIVIADDHPLFRGALRQAIASIMPKARVIEANGMEDLNMALGHERDVDLILLDLTMPGVQGFSGLMSLRAQHPGTARGHRVRHRGGRRSFAAPWNSAPAGFIPKSIDIDSIGGAIEAVLAGDTWTPPDVDLTAAEDKETADLVRRLGTLTPQQVRVLTMLSEGLLNKQIAYELSVSEATVKAHVSAILDKLGVDSRTQAVIAAAKIGVTQRPSPAITD